MTVRIWGNPRTISNLNCLFSMYNWKWVNLKGQCPDYAHARASFVFSSKDNRTVIHVLTRQDFFPDRTADGVLLFTFSTNILDFRRSFLSYLKFGSRHDRRLIAMLSLAGPPRGPKNSLRSLLAFLMWNSCQRSIVPSPVIFAWFARVLASNVWKV